jgi:hypothetical protein
VTYLQNGRSLSRCCRPIYSHPRIELAFPREEPAFHQLLPRSCRTSTHSISPTVFAPYSVAIALPSFPPRYLIFHQPTLEKWGRTSVKSILRRKAAVADFRRIVWLFGFFHAEHNCCQPRTFDLGKNVPSTWLCNARYPVISYGR